MPRPWLWLNGLVVVLFLSIALFLGNAEYSRKESVRGWLVSQPGVVRVVHQGSAVVRDVVRKSGEQVKQGEPLIYLSMDSTLADGNSMNEQVLVQLRKEVNEVDAQLDLSRAQQELDTDSLILQLEEFDAGIDSLLSRIREQRHLFNLSGEKLRRLENAALGGAVTDWDLIQQQENLGVLEQGLGMLQQDMASQQRERELLTSRQKSVPLQAEIQRSILRARRTQLAQQIAEFESKRLSVLNSPVTGTVASVEIRAGSTVAPQQLLMTLLPADMKLAAEVYVPSRAAGFIRPGQLVRLTYDAFPRQQFGTFEGRIRRVSEFVLLPDEIPQTFPLREATYKVSVEIRDTVIDTEAGIASLRPGMLLAAEIVLEKRNLIDWLLEPLRLRRSTAR
ncbi:MAG: HlyD family efflux transporter periplasmic adaptor subunit [Proteobacteria bacterium]|nr:HlyD family efflux transporter periplasmic adaptor subunit [Pseudomonadota bacterium]